jgi:thermitase
MKRVITAFFLVFIIFSASWAKSVPGQVIVKFKPGVIERFKGMQAADVSAAAIKASSIKALNSKIGVVKVEQLYRKALENRPDWEHLADDYLIYFPETGSVKRAVDEYQIDPNVISARENTIVRAYDTIPNDPEFTNQYGLTNIKCPQAWDRTTGSSGVIVAVLDTGITASHVDFAGKIDSRGYDFVNEDSDPADDYGHGTSVSGVIGAATNNGIGIAGVDWAAKILPVKVLDQNGNGSMSDILQGIVYANSLSVEVMNMSFGQYLPDSGLQQRCLEAYQNDVVLIAAAGNGGVEEWNGNPSYPAGYSYVLSIAAVDQNDVRSVWGGIDPTTGNIQSSNYGDWIDLSAPGTGIMSTNMSGGYTLGNNGTSLAAPFVAGAASLIRAASPGLTNQQVMDRLTNTTDDIDSLQDPQYRGKLGSGRLNAADAVAGVSADIDSPSSGEYVKGSVGINGSADGWNFSSYEVIALKGSTVEAIISTSTLTVDAGLLGTWDTAGLDGEYTIRLKVYSTGAQSDEADVIVTADNTTPEAEISYPVSGASIASEVTILGTAKDQYFDRYILEYGEGSSPTIFQTIKESYNPVDAAALATWETLALTGDYTLRLTVYDLVGTTSTETILVTLNNTGVPDERVLSQDNLPITYALPNPFNRSTTSSVTFNYLLASNFNTKIYLFDLNGSLIWQASYLAGANGGKSGDNNPAWSGVDVLGRRVLNGIYFYQIIADGKVLARGKVIVLN